MMLRGNVFQETSLVKTNIMSLNFLGKLSLISLLGQILTFLIYPILAYYYKPDQIGEYRYYLELAAFLTILSSLAFDKAIFVAPKKEKIQLIFIGVCFTLLIMALVLLFASLLKNILLAITAILLPLSVIFLYANSYYSSIGKKINLYWMKTTQVGSSFFMKLLICISLFDFRALLFTELISRLFGIIVSAKSSLINFKESVANIDFSIKSTAQVVKKYSTYPLKSYPGMVINAISLFFPIYFIEQYYGFSEVGIYTLCLTLTLAPISLLSGNLSTVIQSSYAEGLDVVREVSLKNMKILLILLATLPVFILFNADFLINFIFGNEWQGMREIIFPISLFAFFWGLSSPFSVNFHLSSKEGELLKIQLIKFLVRLIYLIFAASILEFYEYVIGYMILCSILQFFQLLRSLSIMKISFNELNPNPIIICLAILLLYFLYIWLDEASSPYVLFLTSPFIIGLAAIQVKKLVFN